ncbi:alpha-glucosidase [Moniliophthora roreri MCA 2997]|uniref:alpha-glucosidase n=1 Tax=Moniliophthora roreri (strain MCA 2997) TaxID=1381753 RepID=V2XCG5_MONRO|nr:alpha-glucosidase [Moniliophthora roreri MCA 2997]
MWIQTVCALGFFAQAAQAVIKVEDSIPHSRNVSHCTGYSLGSLSHTENGFTAQLNLAGTPCNAFGTDILYLTLEVTYESNSRLHVNIFDSDDKQYTIPESIISRPAPPTESFVESSDLVFNYVPTPFAFWITRRSDPALPPIFDTRLDSLPSAPLPPVIENDTSTALDGFDLVFEDQYLQLTSALPEDANVYGLGEYYATTGFRRRIVENGGSIQTMWARDAADPIDENMYGSHPFYLEHRYNQAAQTSMSHGVFLMSSAGGDIMLLTPRDTAQSLIQYRMIGGTLDLYFFSGPTPVAVIEQYGEMIGFPTWQPIWGFGFHLCRWGYHNINETREQVKEMRAAGVPLEVMWNDIDLYTAYRDFTTDPGRFPAEDVRGFIRELASNHQKYIPIVDAAIAKQVNNTDFYDVYTRGAELDVFVKNPDGSEHVGIVWPGYTVFPDWLAPATQAWWTEALKNWSDSGVEYSGIWLDMNEIASFCEGSCGTGQDLGILQVPPLVLPGSPGNLVTDYPECYDPERFGPSGNITVNGTLTCQPDNSIAKRGLGAGGQSNINVISPPYAIHNGNGPLAVNTLATNATHSGGVLDLDIHNMFGMMEEKATHLALQQLQPGKRPFLISRSTFPSSGKWTGHWLGDNFSKWQYLYLNIQGVLQFQLFQIPFVGADACGFNGNTDEELCNRWMQLSAFTPFYRNHNVLGAIPQEPWRWASVSTASRTAIATRYSMLPYWYTLFANSSIRGTPPVRALFFEFPDDPSLFSLDRQFMIGRDILVTPVLEPNVTTVEGTFPGRGQVIWRDFYTHTAIEPSSDGTVTLSAPLGHINVHVRDSAAILLHAEPGYTIEETRQGPFSLLVSLSQSGVAFGSSYIDDGISSPPGPNTTINFMISNNELNITPVGEFHVEQKLQEIVILGVEDKPQNLSLDGVSLQSFDFDSERQELKIRNLSIDLNVAQTLTWN